MHKSSTLAFFTAAVTTSTNVTNETNPTRKKIGTARDLWRCLTFVAITYCRRLSDTGSMLVVNKRHSTILNHQTPFAWFYLRHIQTLLRHNLQVNSEAVLECSSFRRRKSLIFHRLRSCCYKLFVWLSGILTHRLDALDSFPGFSDSIMVSILLGKYCTLLLHLWFLDKLEDPAFSITKKSRGCIAATQWVH